MVTSRREWIIIKNCFWCVELSEHSQVPDLYGWAHDLAQLVAYFSTRNALTFLAEQQIQRMCQEAALALLPLEEPEYALLCRSQLLDTLGALIHHLRVADVELYQHSLYVLHLVWWLLRSFSLPGEFMANIEIAAFLHDLGKLSIPAELLRKPADLTCQEREEVKKHPVSGARMLTSIPSLRVAATMIFHHHERWDGRGYPLGLQGSQIPLGARIITIADAFAAITSRRSYHAPRSLEEALAELARCSGSQFDPLLVEHFCAASP